MNAAGLAVVVALGTLLVLPTPVAASCIAPPPIEEAVESAEMVFIGTVRDVANHNRTAGVEVQEIWRGPDLPARVIVHGGPEDPNLITSVDRTFAAGTTYLFVLSAVGRPLQDSGCSSTVEWNAGLGALRPADARPPRAGEAQGSLPVIGLSVGLLAVALLSALAFRASRPPHR
jgi:hypothetical protein